MVPYTRILPVRPHNEWFEPTPGYGAPLRAAVAGAAHPSRYMHKRRKIVRVAMWVVFLCAVPAIASAQLNGESTTHKWIDSFGSYRQDINPNNKDQISTCQEKLKSVLTEIDSNQDCESDAQCALVGQEPFGHTVPVRADVADSLVAKMKDFRELCISESYQAFYNPDLVHTPICLKRKCMVETSDKERAYNKGVQRDATHR